MQRQGHGARARGIAVSRGAVGSGGRAELSGGGGPLGRAARRLASCGAPALGWGAGVRAGGRARLLGLLLVLSLGLLGLGLGLGVGVPGVAQAAGGVLAPAWGPRDQEGPSGLDQPLVDEQGTLLGWHYQEASGQAGLGFDVRAPFYAALVGLGGVDAVGYPLSAPFWGPDGCAYQVFQVLVLQACGAGAASVGAGAGEEAVAAAVVPANTFELLSHYGADVALLDLGLGPPEGDSSPSFAAAVQRRLEWLTDDAIRQRYLDQCGGSDVTVAWQFCGLPMNRPQAFGPYVTQRFQRIAFQRWLVDGPGGIRAGDVTPMLGGTLLVQTGVLAGPALQPHAPGQPLALQSLAWTDLAAAGSGGGGAALAPSATPTLAPTLMPTPSGGTITTVAGGVTGDGGPATSAQLNYPRGVAVGPDGSLYIADTSNYCVRQVAPDGTNTTVAGTGTPGYSGDGGPATRAQLSGPSGVAVGPDGSLYIADSDNDRVRKVTAPITASTASAPTLTPMPSATLGLARR